MPPPRGALEHHRVADAQGFGLGMGEVTEQPAAGQQRHAVLLGQRAGRVLEAERAHLFRRGADERDARGLAGLGEAGVLREEAVAGMDGACASGLGRGEDAVGVEVALRRGRRADAHGGVGGGDVGRVGVGLGVHRDRTQPHRPQRADDAAGDRPAVGDQHGVETGSGGGHRVRSLVPGRPGGIGFVQRVVPPHGPVQAGSQNTNSTGVGL